MTSTLVSISNEIPEFEDLVNTFVARDFARVAIYAEAMAYRDGALQALQLALISLCRQGNFAKAHWLAQIAIDRTRPKDPQSADLIGLAVGKNTLQSIMSENLPPIEKCQAAYYAGAAKVSGGEIELARGHFVACLEIGAPCLELYLAEAELNALVI